jgi:acetyl esterase/lipase
MSSAQGQERPISKDLVYSTVGNSNRLLDVYYPQTPAPRAGYPLIVSIHGGAWEGADRHSDLILRKLTEHGFALASVDYRLSHEAVYPAQIDDVRESVHWLVANAASLHLDTNKIVATGISAGGHLALLLGLSQTTGDRTIKGVCALYGPTDLTKYADVKGPNAVTRLLGGPITEKITLAKEASPLSYVSKNSVPVMLFHGEKDELVPVAQSIALDDAMKAAGAKSTLIIYQDRGHAFGLDDATVMEVGKFYERCFQD